MCVAYSGILALHNIQFKVSVSADSSLAKLELSLKFFSFRAFVGDAICVDSRAHIKCTSSLDKNTTFLKELFDAILLGL